MTHSLAELLADTLGQSLSRSTRKLVTRSGFRKRGFHNSRRFGRLAWESAIERQMLQRLDYSWLTRQVEVQALTIRVPCLSDERGFFLYTPDAIALDQRGQIHVLEAKGADDLKSDATRTKHRDIRMHLDPRGVDFVEVCEHDLGSPALKANLELLARAGRVLPLTRQLDSTLALIRRHGPFTFEDLAALLGHARALHALATGLMTFNVHQALDPNTALGTQPSEESDAALFLYARSATAPLQGALRHHWGQQRPHHPPQ